MKEFDNPKDALEYLQNEAKEGETIIVDERPTSFHKRTIRRFTKHSLKSQKEKGE